MKLQTIHCSINETIELAWKEQLEKANSQPLLAEELLDRGTEIEPRFACFYRQLLALPRRTRRTFSRKFAVPLAGVAMMFALSNQSVKAATISVDGVSCSLADAIVAANTDTAVGGCTAGFEADVIELEPESTHTLTDNNFLPTISSEVIIEGHNSTIQRDVNAEDFRILTVRDAPKFSLIGTTISGGKVIDHGGGLYIYGDIFDVDVKIENSSIINNSSGGYGGGLFLDSDFFNFTLGQLKILNSNISGNTSSTSGGGFYHTTYSRVDIEIDQSIISGNSASRNGGGVSTGGYEIDIDISNSIISGNTAGVGDGGLSSPGSEYAAFVNLNILNSTITGNTAKSGGGGIGTYNTDVMIEKSTLSDNIAEYGGGLDFSGFANISIINSTLSGNQAAYGGGGDIDVWYGKSTITNTTITDNFAEVEGGGLRLNSFFSNSVKNTIISGNFAPLASEIYSPFTNFEINNNLFGVEGNSGVEGFIPDSSNIIPPAGIQLSDILDPVLANHGGLTSTHALVSDSLAVDAIAVSDPNCNGDDQRNVTRPQGAACDIGAFELELNGSADLTVFAEKDSSIIRANPNRNEGANPLLPLSGSRRILVGFDMSLVDLEQLVSASLILTVNNELRPNSWGRNGSHVNVHRVREGWEEGNGKFFDVPFLDKTPGTGSGVTWNCSIDDQLLNPNTNCDISWEGGAFLPTPSGSILHTNGINGEIELDITLDVKNGFSSWILKKESGSSGRVNYYSKDHPEVVINPDLAPRLLLVFES